jgi:hypothetical protein
MFAWVNVITGFSGGESSALTITLGKSGAATELVTATSVFDGDEGLIAADGAYTLGTFEATAYAPIATFASTGDDLDNIDVGLLEVCIQYETIGSDPVTG